MLLLNGVSRFDCAIAAIKGAAKSNEKVRLREQELLTEFQGEIVKVTEFIMKEKTDPEYLANVEHLKVNSQSLSEG